MSEIFSKLFKNLKSKWRQWAKFTLLALAGAATIILLLMLALGTPGKHHTSCQNMPSALHHFNQDYANDEKWFQQEELLPQNILAIDFDSTRLIYHTGTDTKYIRYENLSSNCAKHVKDTLFNTLIIKALNTDSILKNGNLKDVAVKIGCDTSYVEEIARQKYKNKELSTEDKIFSLIYNTIAGDSEGHYAVSISNNKLEVHRRMNFDKIDTTAFLAVMREDNFSKRERYFLAQADSIRSIGSDQNQYFALGDVQEKALLKDCRFVYLDIRHDTLQIGKERYPLTEQLGYVQQLKRCPEGIFYLPPNSKELQRLMPGDVCGTMDLEKIKGDEMNGKLLHSFCLLRTFGHPVFVWCIMVLLLLLIAAAIWLFATEKKPKAKIIFRLPAGSSPAPDDQPEDKTIKLSNPLEKSLPLILQELDATLGTHFEKQRQDLEAAKAKAEGDLQKEQGRAKTDLNNKSAEIKSLRETKDAEINRLNTTIKSHVETIKEHAKKIKEQEKQIGELQERLKEVEESEKLLAGTQKAMEEFTNRCKNLHPGSTEKEQLTWERLAITLYAYDAVCNLVSVWEQKFSDSAFTAKHLWDQALQRQNFAQTVQNDAMVLAVLKEFINYLNNKDKSNTSDINNRINNAIKKYYHPLPDTSNLTLPEIKGLDEVMLKAVHAQRTIEAQSPYINAMWDNFVKEFANEKISDHDRAWYIEHVVNIAHHAADFILIQKGQPVYLCANYQFLKSGFDTTIPQCREFVNHHVEKSSTNSQKVFEWMNELGVDHLKVLIDEYFIKP